MATLPQKKPETKAQRRLNSRIADYAAMMNNPNGKAYKQPPGTFHQPGSNKK